MQQQRTLEVFTVYPPGRGLNTDKTWTEADLTEAKRLFGHMGNPVDRDRDYEGMIFTPPCDLNVVILPVPTCQTPEQVIIQICNKSGEILFAGMTSHFKKRNAVVAVAVGKDDASTSILIRIEW
jgi:hypothetical protein